MQEEALRQFMGKLGLSGIERRHDRVKDVVYLNHSCPFAQWLHKHGSDRSASFGIIVNDTGVSIFKCWTCGQKGSTGTLVKRLAHYRQQNLDHLLEEAEAAERAGKTYRPFDELPPLPPEMVPVDEAMWDGMFDTISAEVRAIEFMNRRRVGAETAEKLGLLYDPEQERILFPVRHTDGLLYGFTGRSIRSEEQLSKRSPKVRDYAGLPKQDLILGSDRWTPDKRTLIVEGLFAYARMHEIGAEEHVNIGALLGSKMTEGKAKILREFGSTVILLLDPDEAGDAGTFGVLDPIAERLKIEDSAIGLLWGHVPIVVPDFPEFDEDVEPDVDNLTMEQLLIMLKTRTWRPDKDQEKALRAAGLWMETNR